MTLSRSKLRKLVKRRARVRANSDREERIERLKNKPATLKLCTDFGISVPNPIPVDYPSRPSEFEIQAFLYAELKSRGADVRGEVPSQCGRFDLVIFDRHKVPWQIIEVKRRGASYETSREFLLKPRNRVAGCEPQIERYEQTLVPVVIVNGMEGAKQYLKDLDQKRLIRQGEESQAETD